MISLKKIHAHQPAPRTMEVIIEGVTLINLCLPHTVGRLGPYAYMVRREGSLAFELYLDEEGRFLFIEYYLDERRPEVFPKDGAYIFDIPPELGVPSFDTSLFESDWDVVTVETDEYLYWYGDALVVVLGDSLMHLVRKIRLGEQSDLLFDRQGRLGAVVFHAITASEKTLLERAAPRV